MTLSAPQIKLYPTFFFKLGLLFAALFSALFIANMASAPAYAACPEPPQGACVETPVNPPSDGSAPIREPKPADGASSWQAPSTRVTFQASCRTWGSSGSWKLSSACASNKSTITSSSPGSPQLGWGLGYHGNGSSFSLAGQTYLSGSSWEIQCGPSGQRSAYAQSWQRETWDWRTDTFTWVPHPNGRTWTKVSSGTRVTGAMPHYSFLGCVYPRDTYQYSTCFWNFNGDAYYSKDKNRNMAGWAHYSKRAPQAGDPSAPTGGSGNTPPSGYCNTSGATSTHVVHKASLDQLGYYSIDVRYSYKRYTKHTWTTHGGALLYSHGWTSSATLPGHAQTWWAYSCRPGLANATEGAFNSQGSIPNRDAFLNPATCPQVTWQCELNDATTAGLDRVAVRNGSVSPNQAVRVMRNGEQVTLTFSTIRVIDTSTPVDIDVSNGETAPSIRNVSNIEYITKVKTGSTPFLGTDPNAASQYFKLYKERGKTATERFETWNDHANENVDKAIAFTWASDTADKPFALSRQWRVNAEFLVPQGGAIDSDGSADASPGMAWKSAAYDCIDYGTTRGSSRVSNGILTSESNPIQVVRATGK